MISAQLRFRVFFESALQQYEMETGTRLVNHPVAERLEDCFSAESVFSLLAEQVQAVDKFGTVYTYRIMESLKGLVSVMYTLSTNPALRSETTGLV
jgi:hypothetical protein